MLTPNLKKISPNKFVIILEIHGKKNRENNRREKDDVCDWWERNDTPSTPRFHIESCHITSEISGLRETNRFSTQYKFATDSLLFSLLKYFQRRNPGRGDGQENPRSVHLSFHGHEKIFHSHFQSNDILSIEHRQKR